GAAAQRRRPRRPGSLRRCGFAWPYLCAPDEAATNDSAYGSRRQPVSRAIKVAAGWPVHVAGATTRLGRPPILSLSSQRLKLAARSFALTPAALPPVSPAS